MLVFAKENLVFLAVPKTGTTAIEGALAPLASIVMRDPPQIKHVPLYRYRRFMAPFLKAAGGIEPEICAMVRHPVDWLGSWYRYRQRDEIAEHENSTRGLSFDDFVTAYCSDDPPPFASVGSQARFLTDEDGAATIDALYRYEARSSFIAFLENRLSTSIALKNLNVSPKAKLSLTQRVLRRLVAERPEEFAIWESART